MGASNQGDTSEASPVIGYEVGDCSTLSRESPGTIYIKNNSRESGSLRVGESIPDAGKEHVVSDDAMDGHHQVRAT